MVDKSLKEYIKTNLKAGFSEAEIKTALLESGWNPAEVSEGFMIVNLAPQKLKKSLLRVIIWVAVLALLGGGGFWGYKYLLPKYFDKKSSSEQVQGAITPRIFSPAERDEQRVLDIRHLQAALDRYYVASQVYPKTLVELISVGFLGQLPVDPQSGESYLYTAFGTPPLHYSLSFILETNVDNLRHGLRTVTSEYLLPAREAALDDPPFFVITDLSRRLFYPGEEVRVQLNSKGDFVINQARLIVVQKNYVDEITPFEFRFPAPQIAGKYSVEVFAFDQKGQGHFQETWLEVKNLDLTEPLPQVQ